MAQYRDRKIEEVVREFASKFLLEEGNGTALLTVTNVHSSSDGKFVTIYFTTYPESAEESALNFAKRKRAEFRDYLKHNSGIARIPFIDFEIDLGEKNRQTIDTISQKP